MSRSKALVSVLLGLVAATGCSGHKTFDAPDREQRIAEAEAMFSVAIFDTVNWEDDNVRALDGNAVYAAECRNCHGRVGEGTTEYSDAQGLSVPSLVQPEWRYAENLDSIRHRVFVGHSAGMPTWGVAGITPREIDAVSFYILERLRPEMLAGSDGG